MPKPLPKEYIERADAAVAYAESVRKMHRRRTGAASQQRKEDIALALLRIKEAMAPLKSEIGRFPHIPATERVERDRDRIRDASARLQAQRRKLWKMNRASRNDARVAGVQV